MLKIELKKILDGHPQKPKLLQNTNNLKTARTISTKFGTPDSPDNRPSTTKCLEIAFFK